MYSLVTVGEERDHIWRKNVSSYLNVILKHKEDTWAIMNIWLVKDMM